jgi:hypothetical protein
MKKKREATEPPMRVVERVQTGVRMEKRLLKVLKALAEYHDLTLGDLLEGIVLHAFDGLCPFQEESLRRIRDLKQIYGLDLDASASHRLIEAGAGGGKSVKACVRGPDRAISSPMGARPGQPPVFRPVPYGIPALARAARRAR